MGGRVLLGAAILGAVFVFLWIIKGGILFGTSDDFPVLFTTVRNKGKSPGEIAEKKAGHGIKVCLIVLAWIAIVLTTAVFSNVTAEAFAGYTQNVAGELVKNPIRASAAMAAMLLIPMSIIFGFINRSRINRFLGTISGIPILICCIGTGIICPMYLNREIWLLIILIYMFIASVTPIWVLLQPRDYLNSLLVYCIMIAAAACYFLVGSEIPLKSFTVHTIVLLAISVFALTGLDVIVHLGRILFQKLFTGKEEGAKSFLENKYAAALITIGAAAVLSAVGYQKILL